MTTPATTTSADAPEARRYNRIRRRLSIADSILSLALLSVLLATGWSTALRDFSYRGAAQNYVLALFVYVTILAALAKLLGLPLDYYGFRLEHRYHLSNQKLRAWIWDETKAWVVGLLLGAALAELVYFIMRQAPRFWWLIAWGMFILLFVFFAQVAPVVLFPLFYKFKPLQREELKQRLMRLGERAGKRVRGVYEWNLSEKTRKANAALAGLGATRRILLADTLLENYSDDEIEAILAHELGHHVHKHILKSIAVHALVTLAGFWVGAGVLRWAVDAGDFQSIADFADLPLLALVSTGISLALLPALNAWSRRNERQADLYAFRSIASVVPFISSMNKLAEQNLAERMPSRAVEWLFHSHPAIAKRIAAAEAWARSQKPSPAQG